MSTAIIIYIMFVLRSKTTHVVLVPITDAAICTCWENAALIIIVCLFLLTVYGDFRGVYCTAACSHDGTPVLPSVLHLKTAYCEVPAHNYYYYSKDSLQLCIIALFSLVQTGQDGKLGVLYEIQSTLAPSPCNIISS